MQRILILGGGSQIAAATIAAAAHNGSASHVVLAGRIDDDGQPTASVRLVAKELQQSHPALGVATVAFDGADSSSHAEVLRTVDVAHGPFDTIIVAFGQLGSPFSLDIDPGQAAALAHVNFSGAISSSLAAINVLRGQPDARLIILSSIAAVRPRVGNVVYGAAKAGLDCFAQEIAAPAAKVGVDITIVRPGFVHSRMTTGLDPAPFATTPDKVAADILDGIERGRTVVHSPSILRPVGRVLRSLPGPMWRRISAQ